MTSEKPAQKFHTDDAAQAIRISTQIWVVTRNQYGISALVCQTSLGGETSGSVAKCRLFSQANYPPKSRPRTVHCLRVVTYLDYYVLSCSCAAIPQNKIRQKYFERNVKQSDSWVLFRPESNPLYLLGCVTRPIVLTSRRSKEFSLSVLRVSKILPWHRS